MVYHVSVEDAPHTLMLLRGPVRRDYEERLDVGYTDVGGVRSRCLKLGN